MRREGRGGQGRRGALENRLCVRDGMDGGFFPSSGPLFRGSCWGCQFATPTLVLLPVRLPTCFDDVKSRRSEPRNSHSHNKADG